MRATFDPYAGAAQLIFAFEASVIGGAGSLWGTLVGGIVLGVAQSLGALVNPQGFFIAGHFAFLAVLFARLFFGDLGQRVRTALISGSDANMSAGAAAVERWTPESRIAVAAAAVIVVVLAVGPAIFSANAVDKLTTLFIYVILALMWNALVGFCGLVSIGQQAFFGLGAYAAIRLADLGVSVYPSLFFGALIVGALSWPLSLLMLRLKGGEFAIGMWVVSELAHLLVNLDTLVRGETGTSLIELNAYANGQPAGAHLLVRARRDGRPARRSSSGCLRSPLGAAIQAIRDNEEAAESIGVRVMSAKRLVFTLAAFGAAMAGALWVATALTFQPKAYFSPLWTAYMIFMALVGGLGTFEGAILGAVIFFAIETWFGDMGVWYLVGLGATALIFALLFPRGFWGWVEDRTSLRLLPVGYRLRFASPDGDAALERSAAQKPRTRVREGADMLLGKTIVITGISSGIGARVGELAQALGADIIGVDVNEPARPLDAFIKADIGSAQGVAEIVQTLPQRFDALCNVAGVSGMIGAAQNAGDQLLWASGIDSKPRAEAARGRRRRQRRFDRRLRLARQSRARQSVRERARFSRSRHAPRRASRFQTRRPIRCRRSFCCCGRCGRRISLCSRTADCG